MKWLWLTTLVVVLDQASKLIADFNLSYAVQNAMFPGFNLTLLYNEGAAFSFLSDAGGWQRWFFIFLSSVISIFLFFWLKKTGDSNKILSAALALVLGGALGNLIDRVIYGHVIDFIQLYYDVYYWPAFNIADAAITLGAGLLILDMLLENKNNGEDNV